VSVDVFADVGLSVALAPPGNMVGGLLLMTLTHAAQANAARQSWP